MPFISSVPRFLTRVVPSVRTPTDPGWAEGWNRTAEFSQDRLDIHNVQEILRRTPRSSRTS